MSQRANPTLIGAFVLGAAAILLAGIVAFGGGKLFRYTVTYVAYFDESVSGLAVGAPVEFRGVRVGSVSKIDVRIDAEQGLVRIPVYLSLEQDRLTRVGGRSGPGDLVEELIRERGLKAQLQTLSLVTGQVGVNLDFHPEFEARYVGEDPKLPEIPTIPTPLEQLKATAREALAKIYALPLEDLFQAVQQSVHGFNDLVNSPELPRALANANQALEEIQDLARNLDRRTDPVARRLEGALDRLDGTLATFESAVADDSSLRADLTRALEEVADAARAIRLLADTIERRPDILLRGREDEGS